MTREDKTIKQLTGLTAILAAFSFIVGTAIFLSVVLTRYAPLMVVGGIFTLIAVAANGILLLTLLIAMITYPHRYWQILQLAGVLLCNIPVAIAYLLFVVHIIKI
ncbi:hypothetical protein [Pedobacter faecalis]|uniref:hypothetical protein n=1 Tax=Pedobacter faecalis TaxID=3041495 RepID=UPI00254AD359|nr:hypothetical protein [Pedobacter sp. ELA7]